MQVKTFRTRGAILAAFSLSMLASLSTGAKAVVLAHKWQAGQQLPYSVTLKGNLSAETNASWAGLLSGVPVDIAVDGDGRWNLNTLSVDANGNGTVQVQIPQLVINGSAWGMNATLKIENGQAIASLNGAGGKKFDVSQWTNPKNALVISPNAQVQALVSVAAETSSTRDSAGSTTAGSASENSATESASQSMNDLARLMPQLWPGRDIALGESWTVDAKIPLESGAPPLSVGTFKMKLQNEELLAGRTVQRVTVTGLVEISGDKAQAINDAAKAKNANAPRVISSTKNITGDILFDAGLGQIARAAFKVVSKDEMRGATPATDKKPASSWTLKHGFNGSIGLQQQ